MSLSRALMSMVLKPLTNCLVLPLLRAWKALWTCVQASNCMQDNYLALGPCAPFLTANLFYHTKWVGSRPSIQVIYWEWSLVHASFCIVPRDFFFLFYFLRKYMNPNYTRDCQQWWYSNFLAWDLLQHYSIYWHRWCLKDLSEFLVLHN